MKIRTRELREEGDWKVECLGEYLKKYSKYFKKGKPDSCDVKNCKEKLSYVYLEMGVNEVGEFFYCRKHIDILVQYQYKKKQY